MATVAEVMNKVARECKVTAPGTWTSATTLTYLELKDLLQETVDELLERVDWPDPITKDKVVTGTGAAAYAMPADFKRLTRDELTVYEQTKSRRAGIPITTRGQWTYLQDLGSAEGNRFYRTSGDEQDGFEISFFPLAVTGDSITVSYVSRNWLSVGGTDGYLWTDEAATLLLPRRLIELGVVWRFRRRKGLPYVDRYNEYELVIGRQANDKKGIRTISFGGVSDDAKPMRVPVPDFIPSA